MKTKKFEVWSGCRRSLKGGTTRASANAIWIKPRSVIKATPEIRSGDEQKEMTRIFDVKR